LRIRLHHDSPPLLCLQTRMELDTYWKIEKKRRDGSGSADQSNAGLTDSFLKDVAIR